MDEELKEIIKDTYRACIMYLNTPSQNESEEMINHLIAIIEKRIEISYEEGKREGADKSFNIIKEVLNGG